MILFILLTITWLIWYLIFISAVFFLSPLNWVEATLVVLIVDLMRRYLDNIRFPKVPV